MFSRAFHLVFLRQVNNVLLANSARHGHKSFDSADISLENLIDSPLSLLIQWPVCSPNCCLSTSAYEITFRQHLFAYKCPTISECTVGCGGRGVCHLKPSTKSFALDHLSGDKTTGANDYDMLPGALCIYLDLVGELPLFTDVTLDKPEQELRKCQVQNRIQFFMAVLTSQFSPWMLTNFGTE